MSTRRLARLLLAAMLIAATFVTTGGGVAQADARVDVNVDDFFYTGKNTIVRAGDTVVWDWVGQAPHTVTASDFSFDSGGLYEGDTYAVTFDQPGTYGYFCIFHGDPEGGGMAGTVTVLPEAGQRLGGSSNVQAALSWSRLTVPDGGADTALLGRDDLFADSVASGSLQGLLDAPLLLTRPEHLDGSVRDELARIGAGRVVILGGTAAISATVEQQLRDLGYGVERVFGADRLQTAIAVAGRYFARADTAILVRAAGSPTQVFVDSLGAGALAANLGVPVFFTATEGLSGSTREYLRTSDITSVIIAGGTAAVGEQVESDLAALDVEVQRAAGADRFETAVQLQLFAELPNEGAVMVPVVDGAGGNAWASGFAAALAGRQAGLLLGGPDGMPGSATQFFFNSEGHAHVVCGPMVSTAACDEATTEASVTPFAQHPRTLLSALDGENPADPGHPAAEGAFEWRPTRDADVFCYNLFLDGLDPASVTAAHIHVGGPNVAGGAITVPLELAGPFPGDYYGCSEVSGNVRAAIYANPNGYYVNLHTEDMPAGAIRGQLVRPSFVRLTDMSGDQEAPGPGDMMGGGFAAVVGNSQIDDQVCVVYIAFTSSPITAAHIHDGDPGAPGPVVVPLEALEQERFLNAECIDTDDAALVADIGANSIGYYVNVHTEDHPDGAIRGNLVDPWPSFASPERPAAGGPPPSFGAWRS